MGFPIFRDMIVGMKRCEPGCACKRHLGMSDEAKAKVIAANKARTITNTTCLVERCGKKVCAKGLCKAHYSKNYRNVVPKDLPFTVYQWEWDDLRIRSIIKAQIDKSDSVRIGARQLTNLPRPCTRGPCLPDRESSSGQRRSYGQVRLVSPQ